MRIVQQQIHPKCQQQHGNEVSGVMVRVAEGANNLKHGVGGGKSVKLHQSDPCLQ